LSADDSRHACEPPLVSVVIATYNRSNVLAMAIQSVLWQSLPDWELLVIGDACTDDTAEVVASFDDPRISFANLPENCGDQSGPNNQGLRRARGCYVALLNHDDIWLPEHLDVCREAIERTDADLVYPRWCVDRNDQRYINGQLRSDRYDPTDRQVIPSAWFFRRELAAEVGPWCSMRDSYLLPSQQWLFRAWTMRKRMRSIPRVTLVHLPASSRPKGYAEREMRDHRGYLGRIAEDPDGFRQELRTLAYRIPRRRRRWHRVALALGVHPNSLEALAKRMSRKDLEQRYRQQRGLGA
jgi:glycosyltransferase involved in cell wall biosynthesis